MSIASVVVNMKLGATVSRAGADGITPSYAVLHTFNSLPSDANLLYTNQFSVLTTANQDFDLSGTLTDALGGACVFTKVYGFMIRNLETTTGRVFRVGGTGGTFSAYLGAEADYIVVQPRGCLVLMGTLDGYTVTNTSADVLRVTNPGGNTQSFAIAILGKS